MSQNSLGGYFNTSFSSQLASFTRREIFDHLRKLKPVMLPKNPNYTSRVREYVLERLGLVEDQMTTHQLFDLVRDAQQFGTDMRKEWKVHDSVTKMYKYAKDFLDKEITFKIRIPKPKKVKKPKKNIFRGLGGFPKI